MELTLKQRKAVANGALPKFTLGWEQPSLDDTIAQAGSFLHSSTTQGVTSAAGAFKADLMAKNAAATDLGGMPSSFTKAAPNGGAGQFLKNNAGGIANAAMSAIDFVGTIGDISKNKISSDEMMGSGGTSNESANGISYQQSKVDEAGISNQIDATAKAGTMAAMGKGAALGGAVGTLFGPVGTGIGTLAGGIIGGIAGLFGSSRAKREAERQKRIAINRTTASNTQNRETAYTTGLRNEFNRENVTDTSQSLFHAEEGVEGAINPRTGATYKKHVVNTAYGKVKAPLNAWVSKGEVIRSKDGSLYRVQSGDNDTARAYLQNGDSVYSKKIINPETGNSIADDAASYAMAGQLDRLDMNLNVGRMMKEAGRRKTNLLPGFLGGTNKYRQLQGFYDGGEDVYRPKGTVGFAPELEPGYTNAAPVITSNPQVTTNPTTTTNTGTSGSKTPGFLSKLWGGIKNAGSGLDLGNIAQLAGAYSIAAQRDARAEGLRAPKSFVANPYEQDALQQLNNLHSDYYPVWAQNRELEGRGKSSIMQSGGLSAGQKMLGYMGLANQTQQNNASALFEHQGRENALRAQAAKASLEAGNQSATRQQQAYQWDEDMLAKAHAARENMLETSAYDRQNALESFFANKFKKNQFDQTMDLYKSNQKIEKDKVQAMIDGMNNNKPTQPTELPKPAEVAIDAAEKAKAGNPEKPTTIELPEAKWDGQYLSRKRKSSGENVKTLLRNLVKALGQDKINAIMKKRGVKTWDDGKFGGATEEALMEFQKSQGWKTRKEGLDGILGGNTFKALQAAIKGK